MKKDGYTIICALNACSHANNHQKAREIFDTIESSIPITSEMYATYIDALARSGELEEAEKILVSMPQRYAIAYMSVLAGCRKFRDVARAERIFKTLIEIDPGNIAPYLLMGGVYAKEGMVSKYSTIMEQINEKNLKKEPGQSHIFISSVINKYEQYKHQTHSFFVEDESHPLIGDITNALDYHRSELERNGYKADISCVMRQDFKTDEERIVHLWRHSEKLALGLGLTLTPENTPLVITKNLRMCPDCHEVTRLISSNVKRIIKIRDASSWHEFNNGVCLCNENYWCDCL